MDLTTVIGSVATFCLLAYSLYAGSNGDIMGSFFDMASAIMVIGGGIFVTVMSCRAD
jgi:flagellar motor component MotA